MKCEVELVAFRDCLEGVVSMLPVRTTYPVLQNVLLEVKSGRLAIMGTDLDTFVRKEIPIQPDPKPVSGKVAVQGRKLLEIVRELSEPLLSILSANSRVKLASGNNRYTFSALDPEEYPELPDMPTTKIGDFPVPLLVECFATTGFAVARDESRPVATGIYWVISKNEMRMVATDTHRLAFVWKTGEFPGESRMIVSPKIFSLLPKEEPTATVEAEGAQLTEPGEDADYSRPEKEPKKEPGKEPTVTVKADSSRIGLEFGGTAIISRLIEGPYLDYERVIPKGHPNKLKADREQLAAALRRAAVFANPSGYPVSFELKPKSVQIVSSMPDLGEAEENLDEAEYTGTELSVAFNAQFLIEFLSHITSEGVIMELGTSTSVGLVRPDEPEYDRLFLLMPIRMD